MSRNSKNSAKYERQKQLARDRQRRRRAQLSEEKIEEKRKYDRERMAKLRAEKKIKKVGDMTEREKRTARKYWRERSKAKRQKKKALEEALANTPPNSPEHNHEEPTQRRSGRKKVKKSRAKVYVTVKKQKKEIKDLKRRVERYKKRLVREKQKAKNVGSPSPRKQVATLLGPEKVSPNVKRQLFLGFALRKQVEQTKKSVEGSKKKNQLMRKVLGNKVFKKCRVQKYFRDLVPYKYNKILKNNDDSLETYKRKSKECVMKRLSHFLEQFYEQDNVSRMCPGKKDYVKKGAIKKQRRVLLHPLNELHTMFMKQNNHKLSLATFTRARPFWVSLPKKCDRETCGCVRHTNMALLVSALNQNKIINERKSSEVLKVVTCSPDNEKCMLGACKECKAKEINFNIEEDFKIKYYKWKNVKEDKVIRNIKKTITRTTKVKEVKKISEIKAEFKKELEDFKRHVYYAEHQTKVIDKKINSLTPDEVVFRIDFSENYMAKLSHEVQSYHFGASKRQLSLNTGVRYNNIDGEIKVACFASVSNNLDHQSHAIWAHIIPIIEKSSLQYPNTKAVHFVSDSPSSQYRNKMNLHLFKTIVPKYFKKVEYLTWNYTEAGHGKGAMDGVGGTLKRLADRKVAYGTDIASAKDFVDALKDSKIYLYEVPSTDIKTKKTEVSLLNVPQVKGIMKVHQVVTHSDGTMTANKLSCFQCPPDCCEHYALKDVVFEETKRGAAPPRKKRQSKGKMVEKKKKRLKLNVEDVFTSSEEDIPNTFFEEMPGSSVKQLNHKLSGEKRQDVFLETLQSGKYVVVEIENEKKKCQQFIGVCQSKVINKEIDVVFMKPLVKDFKLYTVNERDVFSVNVDQIKLVLDTPEVISKGNRWYYKFSEVPH